MSTKRTVALSEATKKALSDVSGALQGEVDEFLNDDELDQDDDTLQAWVEAQQALIDDLEGIDKEVQVAEAEQE